MFRILLLSMFLLIPYFLPGQSIREIDFRNHTYPLSGVLLGHANMQWLGAENGMRSKSPVHLVRGSNMSNADIGAESFTLESVVYGDVTGDGAEEAVVDLKYHTGGTQTTDYVYIFANNGAMLKLLAYCHTGDRAYAGLYGAYADNGQLVVELFDPEKANGDCCSNGVVITRYAWTGTRFEIRGKVQRRVLPPLTAH